VVFSVGQLLRILNLFSQPAILRSAEGLELWPQRSAQ
jgi:hypothetical protein